MSDATYLAALAGLLHDIGKFTLRAAESGTRSWDAEAKGDFRYKHAMLTASFVQRYVPERWRAEVQQAAGNHHRPQRREDWVVTLADHLSAAERDDGIEDEEVRKTHPKQLLSVFAGIQADGQTLSAAQRERSYLPLAELKLERGNLFPTEALEGDAVWRRYHELYVDFTREAERLKEAHEQDGDLPTYVESLALLMQRYTWAIPSAYYGSLPDISLYDHSRMTAALAAVLAASQLDEARLREVSSRPQTDEPIALLVGADIGGVQDFIYTITSRGATSALRGRSFYLQLLTEAVTRYVLRRLALPITNVIYAGGGNLYLLARPDDKAQLRQIQIEIGRMLMQQHQGDLNVVVEAVSLAGKDFFADGISAAWQRLAEALQQAKARRFAEMNSGDLEWLFAPHGTGGLEPARGVQGGGCQVCGTEHPRSREQDEVRKCPACWSYEELGEDLRRARYLLLEEIAPEAADLHMVAGGWQEALAGLGMRARAIEDMPAASGQGRKVLLALKDEALAALTPGPWLAVGRRLLVNVTPIVTEWELRDARDARLTDLPAPGSIKPFGVLEWQSTGIKRLGVLRMDVDDLGRLFREGLGKKATLSRVASLSFAVSLYFEGWVERLAELMNQEIGKEVLYSIYSGGDDLFFVGAWDVLVEFARRVRADLTPYAANHPGIHASTGIALVGGKYPLYQAASDAGYAEEAAKAYRNGAREKDAVCFLKQVQPWERFGLKVSGGDGAETVYALMRLLVELTDTYNGRRRAAPKALIHNLARLYRQYAEEEDKRRKAGRDVNGSGEQQPLWGPWMWRGVWMLTRMAERSGEEMKAEVEGLRERLREKEFRDMAWMGLAARWAELLSR